MQRPAAPAAAPAEGTRGLHSPLRAGGCIPRPSPGLKTGLGLELPFLELLVDTGSIPQGRAHLDFFIFFFPLNAIRSGSAEMNSVARCTELGY